MNGRWRPDQLMGAGCAGGSTPGEKDVGGGRQSGSGRRRSQDRQCVAPARAAKFTIILVAHVTA
jgi:hypothetical protein